MRLACAQAARTLDWRQHGLARYSTHREPEKKQPAARHEGHSLEAFRDRRRDLCGHDLEGAGDDRTRLAKDQAEPSVALARELGLLNLAEETWEAFRAANADLHFGTEYGVEVDEEDARMVKITAAAMNHLTVRPITPKVAGMGRLLDSRPTDNGRKSHA